MDFSERQKPDHIVKTLVYGAIVVSVLCYGGVVYQTRKDKILRQQETSQLEDLTESTN